MTIQRTLPDLARLINAEHEACLASASDTVARYIKTGQYLAEAKAQVQHGEWAGWVEVNCRFGTRQASSYMRAYANRREQIGSAASDFDSLREAIAALAEPRPALDPPPASSRIPAGLPAEAGRRGSSMRSSRRGSSLRPSRHPRKYFRPFAGVVLTRWISCYYKGMPSVSPCRNSRLI
jgi:hypothetical protein